MSSSRLVPFRWNVLSVIVILLLSAWSPPANSQSLKIYVIDVEQGAATLFVSPSGRTLLVDSGKNGHGARLKAAMDAAGVAQIDHFVATHYHEDHYGGIDELVEDFGVSVVQAYDRGDKTLALLGAAKLAEPTYLDYQRAVGEDARPLRRGMTIPLDPEMTVTCVAAGGVVIGETSPQTGIDENDMSVSLVIRFGGFSYFVGGDAHKPTERKIAARDLVVNVDVYQANHHGSDTSSAEEFLGDLMPTIVVISNGNHAGFKHPQRITLTNLGNLTPPPTVFQTNKYLHGDPTGGNVPDAFIADPESDDDGGTILIAVNAASQSYSVSYGSVSRAFQVKGGGTTNAVIIAGVLPNPVGDDNELETVTLHNAGATAVSLAGWSLRDEAGLTWTLGGLGSLPPGGSTTVQRNRQLMSLNNAGDQISLLDPQGRVQDAFRYTSSMEGMSIITGH